jgi:hypothetical protein
MTGALIALFWVIIALLGALSASAFLSGFRGRI